MNTTMTINDVISKLQDHCKNADLAELNRMVAVVVPDDPAVFTTKDDAYMNIGMYVMMSDSKEIIDLYNAAFNENLTEEMVEGD